MANLMAGKQIVPELIQSEFTAENIVREVKRLLPDGPQRQSMMDELARMRGLLKIQRVGGAGGAIDRVAEVALEMLERFRFTC
jgi:lipid-A-disaccharide synthase